LEYVSDGIAEGIINRLSQVSTLSKVMSSSTVRRYKAAEVDAQTVGQEINVRAVVMGSMVQIGDNIRINVELVDGENNATLWGDSYTRPLSELYEIEEYLSREIADALGIQLTAEQGEQLVKRNTESSEAHQAYLQGPTLSSDRDKGSRGKGHSVLQRGDSERSELRTWLCRAVRRPPSNEQ